MPETHDVVWTPEKVERIWSYYAANPSYGAQFFSAHAGASIAARADRELGLRGKRVLDFGCGRGDLLAHLFARGIRARGLEFSTTAAEETRARFAQEPLFEGVELATALPSSLPDASFDTVMLVEVIEHLLDEQIPETLGEVRRLLAPGGYVVVTTVNEEDLEASKVLCPDCGAIFHRWQHQRSFSADSLAALLERHGFEAASARGIFWALTPLARLRTKLRHPFERVPQPHLLALARR